MALGVGLMFIEGGIDLLYDKRIKVELRIGITKNKNRRNTIETP